MARPTRLESYQLIHGRLWNKGLNYIHHPFVSYDVSIPEAGFVGPVSEAQYSTFSYQVIDAGTIVEGAADKWVANLLPVRSKSVLVRKVYLELEKELKTLDTERREMIGEGVFTRGAIVSGHPGIGKTFFLTFLLVIRLLEGKPTVFQADENSRTYFRFDASGVYYVDISASTTQGVLHDPLDREDSTWALCEGKPSPQLLDGGRDWFFVQASAVGSEFYGRWKEENSIPVYFMDVWTWEEMIAAMPIRDRGFDMIDKLHLLFIRYGPVPRTCLNLLYPMADFDRWKLKVGAYEARLRGKAKEMLLNAPLATTQGKAWDTSSHLFFTLRPFENPSAFSTPVYGAPVTVSFAQQWRTTIETPYLARLIGAVADSLSVFTYSRFLDTLLLEDYTRPAAQFLFEGLAHSRLSEGGTFKIHSFGLGAIERIDFRILPKGSHNFTTITHLRDTLFTLYPPPESDDLSSVLPPDSETLIHRYLHISSPSIEAPKGLVLIPCGGGLSPPCRAVILRFAPFPTITDPAEVMAIFDAIPPHLLDTRRFSPFLVHCMPPLNRSRIGGSFGGKGIRMDGVDGWPKKAKQWVLTIEDRFTKWGADPARSEGKDLNH